MLEALTDPAMLPSSWRVAPQSSDAEEIRGLADSYETQPGVMTVEVQAEAIKSLFEASKLLQTAVVVAAVVLLIAAGMLILNTIRTAIFARRREIEVMKLVGATNSFIRIPFMLEGLIQGLVGALAAVGLTRMFLWLVNDRTGPGESLALLQNFYVSAAEVRSTSLILVVVGVLVGTVGSGIAVTRFLDV
jgi:cell division transport system permease protein